MNTKTPQRQGLDSIVLLILLVASTMLMILLIFIPAPTQAATDVSPGGDEITETTGVTDGDAVAEDEADTRGVDTMSISQCPSGYLCLWSGTSYTGSFTKYAFTGNNRSITLSTVRSLWNNRSDRSFLYSGSGATGSRACYGPGYRTGSLSGWPTSANSLYISSLQNC